MYVLVQNRNIQYVTANQDNTDSVSRTKQDDYNLN